MSPFVSYRDANRSEHASVRVSYRARCLRSLVRLVPVRVHDMFLNCGEDGTKLQEGRVKKECPETTVALDVAFKVLDILGCEFGDLGGDGHEGQEVRKLLCGVFNRRIVKVKSHAIGPGEGKRR